MALENENIELEEGAQEKPESKELEIDYSKLDPAQIPHEVADKSPAFIGLKQNLFELRHQVKEMEQERNELIARLDAVDANKGGDPEEFITRKQLEHELAEKDKQLAAREAKLVQDTRTKRQIDSEMDLKAELTADRAGEGLDAKAVLEKGGLWLAQNKPELFRAAMASSDPAREVYNLAVSMCPEFIQRKQKLHDAKLIASFNKGRPSKVEFGEEEIDSAGTSLIDLLKMDSESLDSAIEQEEFSPE